ncbi:MAG: sugar transferase [Gemmatimonadota bacterium]|nr:MAG: sugar transferase [Gemmatimonadota bacterium]
MSLGVAQDVSGQVAPASRQAKAAAVKQPEAVEVGRPKRDPWVYSIAKRAVDLTVSFIALVVTSPLMAVIGLAIKLESKGPVLFGHVRVGRGGKSFRCYKFRTMRRGAQKELLVNANLKRRYVENDYKLPLEEDPRVTAVGRFLRKSSLDELPQLFNVLGGSMSLVGPRPIVREELRWYGSKAQLFLSVRPGITGVWQVLGRSRIGYPDRTEVELDGIRRRSFWGDMKVLLRSIPAVIVARGSL